MYPPATTATVIVALDAIDFPLLEAPSLGLSCHLFPATKVQYEYFLGGTPGASAVCYCEMLSACPRVTWRGISGAPPDGVFATAARPDDAAPLAAWLGEGFRLPSADEWRRMDAALAAPADPNQLTAMAADPRVHPCARALIAAARGPQTWRSIGLFSDGLLEWVRCADGKFGLYGRPRPDLFRAILNPQRYPPLMPATAARQRAFGFRLFRSLAAGGLT